MSEYEFNHTIDEEELVKLLLGQSVEVEKDYVEEGGNVTSFSLELQLNDITLRRLAQLLAEA